MSRFIPETPGGSQLADLEADTEEKAWANLLDSAGHMYPTVEALKRRGYVVFEIKTSKKKGKR